MRIKQTFTALGAFFALAIGIAACGSGVPGDAVAVMSGNPISTQAFDHWMYVDAKGNAAQSPGAPVIVPTDPPQFSACLKQVRKQIPSLAKTPDKTIRADCKQLFTSLATQVMDFLIKAYWYQAEANKLGVKVTQAQINKAFQTARKQQFPTNAEFQAYQTQTGQTVADLVYRIKINQIYEALLKRTTKKVTPAAIAAYYKQHANQFGTPETRNLRFVRTNSQAKAAAALKALQSGQSWAAVAKADSVDTATKNNGGQVTNITRGQEEHALDQAAFAAPQNKVMGPIQGTFGWYVFEVTKITGATTQSPQKATPLITQLLNSQAQTNAQTAVDAHAKKDWSSQTICRSGYSMADCNGYKPPKPVSTPTVTPTTTGTATTPTVTSSSTTTTSKKK